MSWKPASVEWVVNHLNAELERLDPIHRTLLTELLVEPRIVPVESRTGESVVVVAEYEGRVLYWSDVEEGWELDYPTTAGGIDERGSSQFDLSHMTWQLFGDPGSRAK